MCALTWVLPDAESAQLEACEAKRVPALLISELSFEASFEASFDYGRLISFLLSCRVSVSARPR